MLLAALLFVQVNGLNTLSIFLGIHIVRTKIQQNNLKLTRPSMKNSQPPNREDGREEGHLTDLTDRTMSEETGVD